jgi:uncharacterized protein with ParB-like and HNH nuclease domain/predicted transport protein
MKADGANLLRFLKNADQLVVPLYQRRYSWTEDEWRQLWADILRVAGDPEGPDHFIGSLVQIGGIALVASHNPLQVIGGQQRLATVSLLLLALDRIAQRRLEGDSKDDDARAIVDEQLHSRYLVDDREREERRYKLLPNEADRGTYLALVEGKPLPDRPARGVVDAFRFFEAQIENSGRRLSDLLSAVSRLLVVEIALERGRDDPQLIFESLNSTGLDLTQADLIRNYVLMRLAPAEQDDLFRYHWRPMEERLGPVGPEGFDRFVRDYLTMRTGQIPRVDQIYRAFKAYVAASGESPTEVARDLHRFSAYYAKLVSGAEEDAEVKAALADINTLKVEVAYPFLLDVLDDRAEGKITRDELVLVLRLVESYVFRRAVAGVPTNALNKIFAALSREVDEGLYLESLQAALLLKDGSGRFPRDKEFRRELLVKDIYNFRNRTYLLDKLENHGRKERVEVTGYTLEHVMPQNPDLSPEWQSELGPEWEQIQAEHLHTLGNLTLTGYNAELSDRPFAEKLTMSGGFKESPIRLNESVRRHDRWTEATIVERGRELAQAACGIWVAPDLPEDVLARYRAARQRVRSTYTLDDFPSLRGELRSLFDELRLRVRNLDAEVSEEIRKQYVSYRAGRIFLCMVPLQNELKLYLAGIDPEAIEDPTGRVRDVRGVGHWGVGDIEVRLASVAEIDPVMELVEQAFRAVEDTASEEEGYPVEAVERVIERALTLEEQQALRRIVEVGLAGGLYPRPWPHAIMLAPPQKRIMALLTIRVREDGSIESAYTAENWETYADVPRARAQAMLGASGWRQLSGAADLERLTDSLDELLTDVTFPGRAKKGEWSGRDFYVILGRHDWEDCQHFGFVGASGGPVYTRPLEQLFPGARVFAYYSSPNRGYVGIGVVKETSRPVREFTVSVDGEKIPILDAPLKDRDVLTRDDPDDLDRCTYLVRVEWLATKPAQEAVWEAGLFANQMIVCRLRDEHTLTTVTEALGIDSEPTP